MYITIIKRLVKIINCKLLKYTNINSKYSFSNSYILIILLITDDYRFDTVKIVNI